MEDIEINKSLFNALNSTGFSIETSKVTMFSTNDKYSHPPFLRFRFKNIEKNHPIYNKIKAIIDNFSGNLKWEMVTNGKTLNYIIIPKIFNVIENDSFYNKDSYINLFTQSEYQKIIDLSLDDIIKLSEDILLKAI